MAMNPTSMFPDTPAQGDALLVKKSLIFSALTQFETRAEEAPALHRLMVEFADAASNGAPATHEQMEGAYRTFSLIGMSQALVHGVELHRALLEKAAFIEENTHIRKPAKDYVNGVKETILQIAKAIPVFHKQASGFLDCADMNKTVLAFADEKLDLHLRLFDQQKMKRGLSKPEIADCALEYDIERGRQAQTLSKAFRNCMITGLSLMQKEIGFYGYIYANSDYPQKRLGECTRIDDRKSFCAIQENAKELIQWLSISKGYVDYEVIQVQTMQQKASGAPRPALLN